jgi:heme-degrading monooxygenase HmoA
MAWNYVIVWEFRVRPERRQEFENFYGPHGDWAQLFRRGEGYGGTELTRDSRDPLRYVTLDFWSSQDMYEKFREQHVAEYRVIDEKCESLTERETEIGKLARVG